MSIEIKSVQSRSDRIRFLRVHEHLNRDVPQWVAPLRFERLQLLSKKGNPFFEYGEMAAWTAERNGELVGRISAQTNSMHQERYADNAGFFGFFDSVNDEDVARALLKTAGDWLRKRGCTHVIGPYQLSINNESGVLVEGFDTPPVFMMPHNPEYYDDLLHRAGLTKAKDLLAWTADPREPLPEKAVAISEMVGAAEGLVVRTVDKRNINRDIDVVMSVHDDAWNDNWGYLPFTRAELKKLSDELKLVLNPKLALIAEVHGEPAAIAIAIPDINEHIRDLNGRLAPFGFVKFLSRMLFKKPTRTRVILLGIRKKFRGGPHWGLSFHLYDRLQRAAREEGYTFAEMSWILEDNRKMNRGIERMGGRQYKRYRVYEAPLDQA